MASKIIDKYGVVTNTAEAALAVRDHLRHAPAAAFSLHVGHGTMYLMTFVDLDQIITEGYAYDDGSARGLQVNIDRVGSYSLPWGNPPQEESYIAEKWHLPTFEAKMFLPFLQTVLTGEDCYPEGEL
jgi:hypothetical protein